MTKQTKIAIETESLLIMQSRAPKRAWCPQCAADVEMISLGSVHLISNLEPVALEKWLNSADLHRSQTAGDTLICLNSMLARVTNTRIR
jgi:hypothetical protein